MQTNDSARDDLSVDAFWHDVRVLLRAIMRQLDDDMGCCGVTLAQCHVLVELSSSVLSLKGLAATIELDASTLSRTVDGLVQEGLVERTADPGDRRAVRLILSAAGRRKVAAINRQCGQYYKTLLGELTPAARRRVLRSVRLLADVMRRSRGAACETEDRPRGNGRRTAARQTKPRSRRKERQNA